MREICQLVGWRPQSRKFINRSWPENWISCPSIVIMSFKKSPSADAFTLVAPNAMSKCSSLQSRMPSTKMTKQKRKSRWGRWNEKKEREKKMTNIKTICLNNKLINNKTVMSYTITYECITSASTSTSDSLHYFYVDSITFVLWCIFIPFSFALLPLSVCRSAIRLCLSRHRSDDSFISEARSKVYNRKPKRTANINAPEKS